MTLRSRIAALVRSRRLALGLSLEDLAGLAGISRPSLWNVEKGKTEPHIETLVRLCRALQVSADEMLGLNEDENPKGD